MPTTYRVRITPRALADLEAIFEHISVDTSQNARELISTLMDAIDSLDTFPHLYAAPRTELPVGGQIRSMPMRRFLVRYQVDDVNKVVHILHVRHGARRDA
jgi:plasmid stabilization system protein ParE